MARGQYFLDLINKRHEPDCRQINVAEIGVKAGETSKMILKHPGVNLLMVDPWRSVPGYVRWSQPVLDVFYAAALKVQKEHQLRCSIFRGTSVAAYKFVRVQHLQYDMVILDADHSYEHVMSDITNWMELLKRGGVVSGRFYGEIDGTTQAVDEYTKKHGLTLVLPEKGHAWHFVKVNDHGE